MAFEMMNEMPKEEIARILILAKKGDEDALLTLLKQCDPLINKYAKLNGFVDPDLKQRLIVEWLIAVKNFDPSRYSAQDAEEAVRQ